jgi:hypothetical protein
MAIKAAGVQDARYAINAIFELAISRNWPKEIDVPAIAAWSLDKMKDDSVAQKALELSRSDEVTHRLFAADLLGLVRSEDGLDALGRLARDNDRRVMSWAFLSMSKYGDWALPILAEVAQLHVSNEQVILLADALVKIGSRQSFELLDKLIEGVQDPVRDAIRRLIGDRRSIS